MIKHLERLKNENQEETKFNKNISKYKPENKVCKKTVIVSKFLFTWNFSISR